MKMWESFLFVKYRPVELVLTTLLNQTLIYCICHKVSKE